MRAPSGIARRNKLKITETVMQALDCRNLKEMLDSYLSGELSVETNHAVLRHLEQCPACRNELAARRTLRDALRRATAQTRFSADAMARLRERLREDAATPMPEAQTDAAPREGFWPRWLGGLFSGIIPVPAAALAMLLIALTVGGFFLIRQQITAAAELSQQLWQEATGDHSYCAPQFKNETGPVRMAAHAHAYDPAYADLDRIAEIGAQGLKLHVAHVCAFAGRNFAHLVYTRESDGSLISLLVTERNARAMKNGTVPADDGLQAGLQQVIHENFKVSAMQTRRHIVLVVTTLTEAETKMLTERIALPVSRHLRQIEALPPSGTPMAK